MKKVNQQEVLTSPTCPPANYGQPSRHAAGCTGALAPPNMAASRESGAQLLARLGSRPSLIQLETSLFMADAGPKSGDAIEFYGPEGTAKTEMLLHLTARCILPTSQGGLEAGVVFVDTDYHFDILRLVTVLEGRLETTDEDRVKQCLRRLYIVRCNSSEQLVITLHSLEHIIASSSEVSLLIVDSISAFYWLDRSTDDSISGQELNQRRCVDILSRYLSDYGIVLIATKQALFGHKMLKNLPQILSLVLKNLPCSLSLVLKNLPQILSLVLKCLPCSLSLALKDIPCTMSLVLNNLPCTLSLVLKGIPCTLSLVLKDPHCPLFSAPEDITLFSALSIERTSPSLVLKDLLSPQPQHSQI
ncbi:XRCC2 [Branchiostoma lanceolatum]|uniref:XRCC2 protein n=1 Tax=Branchiostoma lanceolatum TaxID=7740 RepID=A0A8J9Z3W1_BRALA|nr:XRCC2 [Branchiostoma lanceolatum]